MVTWLPHLMATSIRPGYDFVVFADGDAFLQDIVRGARVGEDWNGWIAGRLGGNLFFGKWGWIDEVLGANHPGVRDGVGRRMGYFMGYSGSSNSVLPSHLEFKSLEVAVSSHVNHFWKLTSEAGRSLEVLKDVEPVALDDFRRSTRASNPWDEAISQIEKVRSPATVVLSGDGSLTWVSMPKLSAPAGNTHIRNSQIPSGISSKTITAIVVGACVVGLGILVVGSLAKGREVPAHSDRVQRDRQAGESTAQSPAH